jgi:hypothetical protein
MKPFKMHFYLYIHQFKPRNRKKNVHLKNKHIIMRSSLVGEIFKKKQDRNLIKILPIGKCFDYNRIFVQPNPIIIQRFFTGNEKQI